MSAPPLTHHEILGLVAPFARQGYHVDLAASDRIERLLQFKPVDLLVAGAAAAAGEAGPRGEAASRLRETLKLSVFERGAFRLTRQLAREDGLQATLQATGEDCAELLSRVAAVDPAIHFRDGPGHAIARSYELRLLPRATVPVPVLVRGLVRVDGLTLTLDLPPTRGMSPDLFLRPDGNLRPALPEDLLAVLGWDWARLVDHPDGWSTKHRLRGGPARRSAGAERALERAAAHLARTLAEPPARFHERHVAARWGVVLRRLIPTLTALGMIGGTFLLPYIVEGPIPPLWFALHYVSIGLLAISFSLQELPRFEIPPWPRRAAMAAWREAPASPVRPVASPSA